MLGGEAGGAALATADELLGRAAAERRGEAAPIDERRGGDSPAAATSLDQAIDAYLTYLRVERGLSSATISAYSTDLRAFARAAHPSGDAWRTDASVATDHLASLTRPPRVLRPASHRRKAAAIRAFYRFLFAEG